MQTTIGKTTVRLVTGDIADQDADAVVTIRALAVEQGHGRFVIRAHSFGPVLLTVEQAN